LTLCTRKQKTRPSKNKLNAIAQARGQTMAQMALAWNRRHKGVTSALVGASRVHQAEENIAALKNLEFTEEELKI